MASKVWSAFGDVNHYIEPFFGSGAVLLARPNYTGQVETVNDKDGFLCNVWRGLQFAPDEVAKWCDWPVNHIDIEVRRQKLIANERYLVDNLLQDDKWFDAELAGYWIYGISAWICTGFTTDAKRSNIGKAGMGVHAQLPDIGTAGKGVHAAYVDSIYNWFRALSERLRRV